MSSAASSTWSQTSSRAAASRYMSSRSKGVTNVRLSRSTTSWVSRSPSCSRSLIWSISARPSSGKRSSSFTRRRAISTAFADAPAYSSKNSCLCGVSRSLTIAGALLSDSARGRVRSRCYPCERGGRNRRFPGVLRRGRAALRERRRARVREDPRLLPRALELRAADVRARAGRRGPHDRGIHARLLPPRAGSLPRDHRDEPAARHAQEPQAAEAPGALSRRPDQALLQARHRAARAAIPIRPSVIAEDSPVGEVFLGEAQLRARVRELGAQIAEDYAERDLLLVALLKASFVFLADLSRAIPLLHQIDFVELAGYNGAATGGQSGVRLLQDVAIPLAGLDVLLVEDVVDTGLTLNSLCKQLERRRPASLRVATLLDRPYRRLVENLPVDYVGFTVPDEFFVGYGFDIDERWRNLPDLRLAKAEALEIVHRIDGRPVDPDLEEQV